MKPDIRMATSAWIEAGRLAFMLRRQGITIPTTELIIAGLALKENCAILTLDHYFLKRYRG